MLFVFFASLIQVYSKKYKREEETALPEAIMRGLYFQNQKAAFDAALEAGDIVQVESDDPNKKFFAFRTYTCGTEDGKAQDHNNTSSKKISAQDAESLKNAFRNLNWCFSYNASSPVTDTSGKLATQVEELLKQAVAAHDRLTKEARGLMSHWTGSPDILQELKKGYGQLLSNASKMNHIRDLNEFPDGKKLTKDSFKIFIKEVAQHAEGFNITVEKAKGEQKARRA